MAGLQWPILGLRGPISGSRGPIQGPGPSKVSGGGGAPGFVYGRGSTRPDPSMANFTPVARALAAPLFTRAKIKYHRLIVTSFQSLAAPDSSVNLSVVRRKYLLGPNMTFSGLR